MRDHTARRSARRRTSVAGLVAQFVLIALIAVAPWLFGSVQARVQVWLFVGVMVALACCVIKLLTDRSTGTVLPWALFPLIAAVGLGVLQLIPLGGKTSAFLSPGAAQVRSTLLPTEGSSDTTLTKNLSIRTDPGRQPLSLYPASTRHDLALLLLGSAMFFLGASLFNGPQAQIWLCGLITVNGAALAFFGLVQKLTWNGFLYWSVPLTQGGAPFGPFVNRNNAGGFLNLCLAGAVGMSVWIVALNRSSGSSPETYQLPGKRSGLTQFRQQLLESISHLNALTLSILSLTACIVTGILCSLSRGAGIAMVGASILTTLVVLCARRRTLRLRAIAVTTMTGLALVSWVGMRESVSTRIATLFDRETIMQHALIPHWRDGLQAVPQFWQVGSGLGTYRYVYGQNQQRLSKRWFYHAENQYLEAIVEGGIVGLGVMLTMMGLVGTAAWRLLRDGRDAKTVAFGIAGIFALTGQAIAAFFDFGLYTPANMVLFALLCGALSGGAVRLAKEKLSTGFLTVPVGRNVAMLLATLLLSANFWGCMEIRNVAAVETVLKDLRVAEKSTTPPTTQELLEGIEQLTPAITHREDDAEAHQQMAKLWMQLYRLRALEQLRAETTLDADDPRLAQATALTVIHSRVSLFVQNNLPAELEKLRAEPVLRDHIKPALKHLILARRACPLLPGVHLMLAQLGGLVADPSDDRIHIERARRLAPGNPSLLFVCGLLDLQSGRLESAWESWKRSLTLSPRYLEDVLRIAGLRLETPGMIEKLLPDSPSLLVQLAQKQYQSEEHDKVRGLLLDRVETLLLKTDLPADECYRLRGSVFALKEDYPQAIENYAAAIKLRSQDVAWRYEFAILLQQQGLLDDAHEQAKWCARLAPRNRKYRELLLQIHEIRLR